MPRFPHLSKLATFSFPAPTTTTKLPSLVIFHSSKRISTSSPSHSHAVPSLQHIIQLILDQKSPSQVLQTFKWASNLPNFTHSQSTYRAVIHKLCSFRHFDSVHQLLEEMPSSIGEPPDEAIFITIIRGLGRVRMIRQVVKVLDLVCKFGMTPSLKVFNSILDVLVKEDIDLARKFYREEMMESGVKGDDYTFGILMKGLCLTNRIGDGFKLLQVIKSSGSKPNTVVYNTLLFALCKNGKIGRARSLMNEMEAPNDVTFNVLISGYCKENNLVQALVMLEKCFSSGLMPDIVTVTKVVEVLCNAGRVTEAVELLERVESKGGKIDVIAYNTLIKGFCRVGKVKVGCGLLKEMERKGCFPNVDTYNALISGFCESGMFNLVLDLFNEMQMDGIQANFTTYDVMIKGLFSGGRMEDGFKILALMEEMKGGSGGCISPYNSVLYGLYKKNLWDDALDFLMKMEQLFPRAVNRSLRIMDLCEQGAIEDAKKVYNQMTEEGGSPSILVYDCLIHGLCIEGRVPETFDLMNEMVGWGYLPVASVLKSIIRGLCTRGKDECALKLIEEMVGKGCIPDAESYSPLIHGLCRKGNLQDAFGLFLQIVERGITPDCSMWNSLLLCLSQEAYWSEPKYLFRVNNLAQFVEET